MRIRHSLTFFKSELVQYNYILEDKDIQLQISNFLLKYISVEAFYKKLLIYKLEKENNKKLPDKQKKFLKVTVKDVKKVLKYYNIEFEDGLVNRIFDGNQNKNYMECSIKSLRDRLVHRANENVIRVILERYDNIEKDLNSFISLFD